MPCDKRADDLVRASSAVHTKSMPVPTRHAAASSAGIHSLESTVAVTHRHIATHASGNACVLYLSRTPTCILQPSSSGMMHESSRVYRHVMLSKRAGDASLGARIEPAQPLVSVTGGACAKAGFLLQVEKPWSLNFLGRTEAPLRGRLAERVCRFAHSLNLFVRGLPAPPGVHRVTASQLSRMRV